MVEKTSKGSAAFAPVLIVFSLVIYLLHYAIFRDAHHIFISFVEEIAFVPIHVLVITLIINKLLSEREKRMRHNNLNMIVSAFFNEVGTSLLKLLPAFDEKSEEIYQELMVNNTWSDKQFREARELILKSDFKMNSQKGDLVELQSMLKQSRDFLLRMLENSNILEYEYFTNLLLAVFHLSDELSHREDVRDLPESDYEHLSADIERVYRGLILEWLKYMRHLKLAYPYLFSMAVRLNPFDPNATPVIGGKVSAS